MLSVLVEQPNEKCGVTDQIYSKFDIVLKNTDEFSFVYYTAIFYFIFYCLFIVWNQRYIRWLSGAQVKFS